MTIGYILIKGEPGKIQEENLEELGISIVEKIRSIDGVLDINTLTTSTMF